jgi:O-antigen/teichoic acid export membrane protein
MCPEFEKKAIGRGAAYIYVESITSLISGYVYWLIVSKIATSEIIGTSSTLITFATIIAVIAGMGIHVGIQRFIGKSFSEKNIQDAKNFVVTSLLLLGIGLFTCSMIILSLQNSIYNAFGFDLVLIMIAILLIVSYNSMMIFRSVVISSLKTQSLPIIFITSSVAKIVITILLLITGTGVAGLTFGFIVNYILSSVLLGIVLLRSIFKQARNNHPLQGFLDNSKKILLSSVVNWIPWLIAIVGSQLGTIVIFGAQGANQAGVYFLALTIVTGITTIMNSLFTIALPALSSLRDHRKRIAWHTIRLSAIIILPFSCSLIFYSDDVMRLFGEEYVNGAISLQILLLSILPVCVISGVTTLLNSYGFYRYVLILGLAMSIPQTILYFTLVPLYDTIGAALGYTIGCVAGCIVSLLQARKIGLHLFWKELGIIFIVSASIGYILSSLQINYIPGILTTIIISYVLLIQVRVVTTNDIVDFLDVLPDKISNPVARLVGKYKKR